MIVNPRRPFIDDEPHGLLESDRDYILNNIDVCVALLDQAQKPVAHLHIRLEEDGCFADVEVHDGTHLQPEHSPVAVFVLPKDKA